jgi:cell shape-determining protein MreD
VADVQQEAAVLWPSLLLPWLLLLLQSVQRR